MRCGTRSWRAAGPPPPTRASSSPRSPAARPPPPGGAPLHLERLAARGGPAERALDPLTFYETSSYGPRALDAMARVVGVDQLVHGSDRPVVAPAPAPGPLGPAAWRAMTEANPARLLG